jgi:hypothetical protein
MEYRRGFSWWPLWKGVNAVFIKRLMVLKLQVFGIVLTIYLYSDGANYPSSSAFVAEERVLIHGVVWRM